MTAPTAGGLQREALSWAIPGAVIREVGGAAASSQLALWAAVVVGTVALVIGCAYEAQGKGRSPAWGLVGLLGVIGVPLLAILDDRRRNGRSCADERTTES